MAKASAAGMDAAWRPYSTAESVRQVDAETFQTWGSMPGSLPWHFTRLETWRSDRDDIEVIRPSLGGSRRPINLGHSHAV